MPKEERFFFKNFYVVTIAIFILVACLGVFVSTHTTEDAIAIGLAVVLPICFLRFAYGKRFANLVTLDFQARTALFSFDDERGNLHRDFKEIREIKFI